jgi:hypothetical protein
LTTLGAEEGYKVGERELFISEDSDENPISSVSGKCFIQHVKEIRKKLLLFSFHTETNLFDLANLEEFCADANRYYYQRWYSSGRFGIVQDPIRGK